MVYRCFRTHSPHPPPWPDHSLPQPDGVRIAHQCTCTHSRIPSHLLRPGWATRSGTFFTHGVPVFPHTLAASPCTLFATSSSVHTGRYFLPRTHSPHPPPPYTLAHPLPPSPPKLGWLGRPWSLTFLRMVYRTGVPAHTRRFLTPWVPTLGAAPSPYTPAASSPLYSLGPHPRRPARRC